MAAGRQIKEEGLPNDLPARIAADPAFGLSEEEIRARLIPENYTGRAASQTEEFFRDVVDPILNANKDKVGIHADINV